MAGRILIADTTAAARTVLAAKLGAARYEILQAGIHEDLFARVQRDHPDMVILGGNREAAEYSGVNVKFIIGAVLVIGAVCSGVAGMLGVAYFGSAQQNEFTTYLLDAIAAVVVGGTSLFGGRGGIPNTIVGLFVLGVLNNGLDHVQIDPFLKILIRGLILLAALVINVYAQRLRSQAENAGD